MATPLQVLIVEDSVRDAALLVRELERGGYEVIHQRVDTADDLRIALCERPWDVIVSDFAMPQFNALAALDVVVSSGIDSPFIIVSGSIGEETAAEAMRSGARDFVLKDNMKRLLPAVARELNTARMDRDRRAAQRDLDFERLLLQQIIDGSPDAISVKDTQRRYVYLNEAERRTLNVGSDQDLRGQLSDFFMAPSRAQLRRHDEERVLATGAAVLNSLEAAIGEDGSTRWLSATRAPIRDLQGSIAGIVAIGRDITENKRQEQMKNEFIATVNHELRTPVTSIVGALRLVNGDIAADNGASRRFFEIALQNSQRLESIVNDILDFERIQAGKMEYHRQMVDVRALVERTIEANQVFSQGYEVRLRLTDRAPECLIVTDPDRLSQIITNLISNAVRFSPKGADVVVALAVTETAVRISVCDHGPGIPFEYAARIFDKFVQVDATDARKKGGTGLGLAIAKQMAMQLGGDITLETAPEAGSRFHIILSRQ